LWVGLVWISAVAGATLPLQDVVALL